MFCTKFEVCCHENPRAVHIKSVKDTYFMMWIKGLIFTGVCHVCVSSVHRGEVA